MVTRFAGRTCFPCLPGTQSREFRLRVPETKPEAVFLEFGRPQLVLASVVSLVLLSLVLLWLLFVLQRRNPLKTRHEPIENEPYITKHANHRTISGDETGPVAGSAMAPCAGTGWSKESGSLQPSAIFLDCCDSFLLCICIIIIIIVLEMSCQ